MSVPLRCRYSGCYVLFTLAKEGVNPEQKRKNESTPPIRVVVEDLNNDMIKLLVDFAYHVPLHEHIGLHNVGNVLELAEKLKVSRELPEALLRLRFEEDGTLLESVAVSMADVYRDRRSAF